MPNIANYNLAELQALVKATDDIATCTDDTACSGVHFEIACHTLHLLSSSGNRDTVQLIGLCKTQATSSILVGFASLQ